MFASTTLDYFIGLGLAGAHVERKRKFLLWTSIIAQLSLLGFFKYFNFFISSITTLASSLGIPSHSLITLNIILPVGISFYTFQTMSYTIDVYRRKVEPTRDFIAFAAFVSFFPQLVAGPIERASHLLGQFLKDRSFSYALAGDGVKQIIWGFFKKIVIADNLGTVVAQIYANSTNASGWELLGATLFFAFQIYTDFSAYSDIAIGTARLFGFDIMRNFNYPYFSKNIIQFWQRWHISLSTWFRDYVYIPLGGSRATTAQYLRNIIVVFLLSGLWHGANWTFVIWGALHGLAFLPLAITKNRDRYRTSKVVEPEFRDLHKIIGTFVFVLFTWVFFRAQSVQESLFILKKIFSTIFSSLPNSTQLYPAWLLGLALFIAFEWIQRQRPHALDVGDWPSWAKVFPYYGMVVITLLFGSFSSAPFIYFQF